MHKIYSQMAVLLLGLSVGNGQRTMADDEIHWDHLERRALGNETRATPVSITPSQYWDGNDGPWSSFILQVGTPAQDVRVLVSTAGFNTWTVNANLGCPNGTMLGCEDSRGTPFLANESLTWVPNSIWELGLEANLGLDSTSNYGFDTVKLGWQGSQVLTVEHSVIANFAITTYWLGIFGLNPMPTNFSNFYDPQPSFMSRLKSSNAIPSLSWSYTAGNRYRLSGDEYGSLVLGGYDQSKFTPVNLTIPFGNDVSRDLLIGVQSISTSNSATAITSASGGFYAFIDSTIAQLWLPIEVCEAFEKAFGLIWNEDSELYLLNDTLHTQLKSKNASVTFTLGVSSSGGETVDIILPYAAFDLQVSYPLQVNKTFYFPLKRAANATKYTLGRTFLQEAYIVADYERRNFTVAPCVWMENAESDIRTIQSIDLKDGTNKKGGITTPAIIGIAVGSAVLLIMIAVSVWFARRMRRKKQILAQSQPTSGLNQGGSGGDNNPYHDEIAKPFIGLYVNGELDSSSEIHELRAPIPRAAEMLGEDGGSRGGTSFHEVEGSNSTSVYEMAGSDVQELPGSRRR